MNRNQTITINFSSYFYFYFQQKIYYSKLQLLTITDFVLFILCVLYFSLDVTAKLFTINYYLKYLLI